MAGVSSLLSPSLSTVKIYNCLRFVNVRFESKVSDTLINIRLQRQITNSNQCLQYVVFEHGFQTGITKVSGNLGVLSSADALNKITWYSSF